MKRHLFFVLVIAYAGQAGSAWAAMSSQPSATRDAGQPATRPVDVLAFDLSRLLAGGPAEAERLREQRDLLRRQLEVATQPADQATAHLAHANWLLAVHAARPATRWLIGLDDEQDRSSLVQAARQAAAHIESARALLQVDTASADQKKRHALERAMSSLLPFTKFFAAVEQAGGTQKRQEAWLDAALELASLREADDPQLAACALLWQAFGWELAGRRERALVSLGPPLTKPEQPHYDFARRMLRCRILADAGQYSAAMALTMRLRSMCKQWFPNIPPEELKARQKVVAVLEFRAGQDWLRQIRGTDAPAAFSLERLLGNLLALPLFSETQTPTYCLPTAVPILVEPPGLAAGSLTSKPATVTASGPAVASPFATSGPASAATQSAPSPNVPSGDAE